MLVAGLAFPATIAVVACNSGTRSSKADAAENASAQVAVVQRGNIDQVLSLAGQFQPYQTVDVHPKVSGFIRHIYVDIGDRVRQGQTLAVLEVPELKAQLSGTVSEVARSGDEIVRAQHEVQRAESTHSAIHADYDRLLQTSQAQPGLVAQQIEFPLDRGLRPKISRRPPRWMRPRRHCPRLRTEWRFLKQTTRE